MRVEQFVMAYGVEQDRLRAILPNGFRSLRPVLRINAEVRDGKRAYLEFNTAVEKDGCRGWLNIGFWNEVYFEKNAETTIFKTDVIEISFSRVGIEGACPAEKDNAGCYFKREEYELKEAEVIMANKEFCDCEFVWKYEMGTFGHSIGKTLPAFSSEINIYQKVEFTVENAAIIPCEQVLGSYAVQFDRNCGV